MTPFAAAAKALIRFYQVSPTDTVTCEIAGTRATNQALVRRVGDLAGEDQPFSAAASTS